MAIPECLLQHLPARTTSVTPIQGFGDSFFVDYPEFRYASLWAIFPRTYGAFKGAIQLLAGYVRPSRPHQKEVTPSVTPRRPGRADA